MGAAVAARLLVALLLALNCTFERLYPEEGKFESKDLIDLTEYLKTECSAQHDKRIKYGFGKTMFAGTTVTAHVSCVPNSPANISVVMYLVHSSCYNEQFLDCLLEVVDAPAVPVVDAHKYSRDADNKADVKVDEKADEKADDKADGKADTSPSADTAAGSSNAVGSGEKSKDQAAAKAAANADESAAKPRVCTCRKSYEGMDFATLPELTLSSSTSVSLSCAKAAVPVTKASGVSSKLKATSDVKTYDNEKAANEAKPYGDKNAANDAKPNNGEKAANTQPNYDAKAANEAEPTDFSADRSPSQTTANERSPLGRATLIATAPIDGVYYVLLRAVSGSEDDSSMKFIVDSAEAKSSYGYLSAVDWPNYYFCMIMVIVYTTFQVAWLIMLACNWKDLLQVQYYIESVILLGMIEQAVLFAEYRNINESGVPVGGVVIFAQIVSSLKRALTRVLVLLLCLGYGLIKPRLGPTLTKVHATGIVYFLLASVTSCHKIHGMDNASNADLVGTIALYVFEIAIFSWVYRSLQQTYKILRLRRSVVKLSLYRHFANTLRVLVLASLLFIGWFLYAVRFSTCVSDFRWLWLQEGVWQTLVTLLLLIVIFLWRPSANNQRKSEQLAVVNRVFEVSSSMSQERLVDLKLGLAVDTDEEPVTAKSGIISME